MNGLRTFFLQAAAAFTGCVAAHVVDSYLIDGSSARNDAQLETDVTRYEELEKNDSRI